MNILLKIKGMSCQNCARHVREALQNAPGVHHAEVNLERAEAHVAGEGIAPGTLAAAVEKAGYRAVVHES
jgi:mercuric reductase